MSEHFNQLARVVNLLVYQQILDDGQWSANQLAIFGLHLGREMHQDLVMVSQLPACQTVSRNVL